MGAKALSKWNIAGHVEERIGDLKDRNLEMIWVEEQREVSSKKVKKLYKNLRIMGIPWEERKKKEKSLFKIKIIVENFPNLGRGKTGYTKPQS